MRWESGEIKKQRKRDALKQWHKFFCLWPRKIGTYIYWLEYIEARIKYEDWEYTEWEYRELSKVTHDKEFQDKMNKVLK